MIVSQSRDKEAYLKAAYSNVRSMALQDLNPLRLCVILTLNYHLDHWVDFVLIKDFIEV